MDKRCDIEIKVISQKGECALDHKVGDRWVVSAKTPEGICAAAFNALFPDLRVLSFGGELPWSSDKDASMVACPDADNPVVFRIERLR